MARRNILKLDLGPIRSDVLTGISKVQDFEEQTKNNNERRVSDTSHGINGSIKPSFHSFSFKTVFPGISTAVLTHWCHMGRVLGKKKSISKCPSEN